MLNPRMVWNSFASLAGRLALPALLMVATALALLVSAPVAAADPARIVSERAQERAAALDQANDPASLPTADAAASASGDDVNIALVVGLVGLVAVVAAFAVHRAARRRTLTGR